MEEIKGMAEAVGKAILTSPVYREYLELAKKMRDKPEPLKSMNRLKEMQEEMVIEGQDNMISLEVENRLCGLYSEIAMDEDAIAFWHCERKVLSLLQDTLETIAQQAPVNILGGYNQ